MSRTLEDLRWLGDRTEYWAVDGDGEPTVYQDATDCSDFRSYECLGCGDEFGNWPDAQRHICRTMQARGRYE